MTDPTVKEAQQKTAAPKASATGVKYTFDNPQVFVRPDRR